MPEDNETESARKQAIDNYHAKTRRLTLAVVQTINRFLAEEGGMSHSQMHNALHSALRSTPITSFCPEPRAGP